MQIKYLTIHDDLLQKIQTNVYPASTLLPSENRLAIKYDTTRETIRKALDLLSHNGHIQKIRGKGSVVLNTNKFSLPVSNIESFAELVEKLDMDSETIVHSIDYLKETDDLFQTMPFEKGRNIWGVSRVRKVDGERIILDHDYFDEQYVPLLSKDICQQSIYAHIEDELRLEIGFAQKEIVIEAPTVEDRELLDLDDFSNLVVIRSQVYLADTSLFQYSVSKHRPDKFRFIDFARRIKN